MRICYVLDIVLGLARIQGERKRQSPFHQEHVICGQGNR